jgi:hypothetical protein
LTGLSFPGFLRGRGGDDGACPCSLVDEEDRPDFLMMLMGAYVSLDADVNVSTVVKVRRRLVHHHRQLHQHHHR